MARKMRQLVVLCSLFAMMLMPCQAVFASEVDVEYPVAPMMTYIVDYNISFGIANGEADVDVWVDGDVEDATRAKVIAELQVKSGSNWIPVAIWTDDQYDYTACVNETHDVVSGHTYRVKGTFMVWEGSASETEMSYSDEITA